MSLKVLHLIDSGGLYGAEKMLLALVKEQIKQGLQPMILSAGEPAIAKKAIEVEARRLGLPVTPWRMKPGLNIKGIKELVNWARGEGYELFHSHGYKFNILLGFLPKKQIAGRTITTVHGYLHAKRFSKMSLYEALDRWFISRFDKVVLVSEAMRSEITERVEPKLVVIPNGIDYEAVESAAEVPVTGEIGRFICHHSPVIVAVGRLSREKGFDRLIDAFALFRQSHPGAGLLIIGEGQERQHLQSVISSRRLNSSVLLPGYTDSVPGCVKAADILAMPSRNEGLPITLLEAMALGATIVASAVGAIPKTLGHGRGGFIVDNETALSFSKALAEAWLHENQGKSRALWAKNQVQASHSIERMSRQYLTVYEAVFSGTLNRQYI